MEFLAALLYYFKESVGVFTIKSVFISGNADMFYALSIFFVFYSLVKDRLMFKKTYTYIAPFIIYSLLQIFVIKDLNILKLIVNVFKIYICIFLFVFIKDYGFKFKFSKFIEIISIFWGISIVISLIFNKSFLWRINDQFNPYAKNRLQLFYLEPSELGFQVAIVLIFLVFYFLYSKERKEKVKYFFFSIFSLVLLYLAKPLGAILLVSTSIFVMITIYLYENLSRKKFSITYASFTAAIILMIVLMIKLNSGIYLRVVDTVKGQDQSNAYRINVSTSVMEASLVNTKGVGVGFGNLNTDKTRKDYQKYGLYQVLANSYIYFVIEGGIFAISILLIFLYKLFRHTLDSKCILRWGLFIFIVSYQIYGGHFTNPLNWIVYGIIYSNYDLKPVNEVVYE